MLLRFLCPHCRVSLDPRDVETGADGVNDYHICPECDGVIAVYAPGVSEAPEPVSQRTSVAQDLQPQVLVA